MLRPQTWRWACHHLSRDESIGDAGRQIWMQVPALLAESPCQCRTSGSPSTPPPPQQL